MHISVDTHENEATYELADDRNAEGDSHDDQQVLVKVFLANFSISYKSIQTECKVETERGDAQVNQDVQQDDDEDTALSTEQLGTESEICKGCTIANLVDLVLRVHNYVLLGFLF